MYFQLGFLCLPLLLSTEGYIFLNNKYEATPIKWGVGRITDFVFYIILLFGLLEQAERRDMWKFPTFPADTNLTDKHIGRGPCGWLKLLEMYPAHRC